MIEINKLYLLDAFELLKQITDGSIDLVLTDPPYNIEWKENIELHGRKAFYHSYEELREWDKLDKSFYFNLFKEFNRILKETGSVIIFCRNELITWILEAGKDNDLDYKATIFINKTNPMPQVRKVNYLSSIESIAWLARKRKKIPYTFNFKTQNEMHNLIRIPICSGKERTNHPTQKSLRLIRFLLEVHSNKGDIVVDCFAGSGTTLVSCKQLGRNFIGCDNNEKYFKMALKRLEQNVISDY